jgi:hypothetical protein
VVCNSHSAPFPTHYSRQRRKYPEIQIELHWPSFLAGLATATDAGESKVALPFGGYESVGLFGDLRRWLDESQPPDVTAVPQGGVSFG